MTFVEWPAIDLLGENSSLNTIAPHGTCICGSFALALPMWRGPVLRCNTRSSK